MQSPVRLWAGQDRRQDLRIGRRNVTNHVNAMTEISKAAQARHDEAVKRGEAGYMDPDTGLFVMTASYLRERGYCCGSACRHCPWDHINVRPRRRRHES